MYAPRVAIPALGKSYVSDFDTSTSQGPLRLTHGDNVHTVAVLAVLWISLLADSPVDQTKPTKVIKAFKNRLETDLMSVIRDYTTLGNTLIHSIKRDADGNIFIDEFLSEFGDTPIFREYHQWTKTYDHELLRYILTFLFFGKKLSYKDSTLDETALRGWYQVEERLKQHVLPPCTSNLATIVKWLFRDVETMTFLPKHGGGSVAEPKVWGSEQKNRLFATGAEVDVAYFRRKGRPDFLVSPNGMAPRTQDEEIPAKLMFVPKDWKKSRSICMEPIMYQWAQQGVRSWFEHHIEVSPWLKNHIRIQDQGLNQRASRSGSVTGTLDTIDLSSASDSVSFALVRRIFPSWVLYHLETTRSKSVELPDGRCIEVCKYAPMGSALCFPVQSTIYAAIILMVSIAEQYGRDWRVDGVLNDIDLDYAYTQCYGRGANRFWKPAYEEFCCYGDDLVTDNAITSNVIEALSLLGFVVNEEKSFIGDHAYRESCGKHYVQGKDVTPLVCKIKWLDQKLGIEELASIIELANLSHDYGYEHLRRHVIQVALHYDISGVKKTPINPILFSSNRDDSLSIFHPNPRNTHLVTRSPEEVTRSRFMFPVGMNPQGFPRIKRRGRLPTHELYQRSEWGSIGIGPDERTKVSKEFDNYRYAVWWSSKYYRVEGNGSPSVPVTANTKGARIKWRWTAIEV